MLQGKNTVLLAFDGRVSWPAPICWSQLKILYGDCDLRLRNGNFSSWKGTLILAASGDADGDDRGDGLNVRIL